MRLLMIVAEGAHANYGKGIRALRIMGWDSQLELRNNGSGWDNMLEQYGKSAELTR